MKRRLTEELGVIMLQVLEVVSCHEYPNLIFALGILVYIDCDVPLEPSLNPCLQAMATTARAGDEVQPGNGLQTEVGDGANEPVSEIECQGEGWPVIVNSACFSGSW